jgi:hypothetical protein
MTGPSQVSTPSPRGSELLTDFLPFNRSSLAEAIDRFLVEFEGLGAELADWRSSTGVFPALAAVTIAAVASDVVCRRSHGGRREAVEEEHNECFARSPSFPGGWSFAET